MVKFTFSQAYLGVKNVVKTWSIHLLNQLKSPPFYDCSNAKRNGEAVCSYHYIRYDHLYEVVLNEIQKQVQYVKIIEDNHLQYLIKSKQF